MKNALKIGTIILFLTFIGIQFIRPNVTNPPINESKTINAKLNVPDEVEQILTRSCNDCHSNKTNWVWYGNIAPASWYMAHHVGEGRAELSFSDWGDYSNGKASRKLKEICEQVEKGEMPLWDYVLLHPSARLSEADKQILCNWTNQEREKLKAKTSIEPQS